MDRVIPKEKFKEHGYWCEDITFLVCIPFKEFPEGLLKAFDDMIGEQDLDDGYLACEYWLPEDDSDIECFVYEFCFEDDVVSANEFFRKPLYNDMIKEVAMECAK